MATTIFNKPLNSEVQEKTNKVLDAVAGNFVSFNANGDIQDSSKSASDFAGTGVATQSAAGLMSAADKTKLDGVATGATANVVSNSLTDSSTTNALSAAQGKALNDKITDYVKIVTHYIGGTGNIAAGGIERFNGINVSSSIPAGYKLIGAYGGHIGTTGIIFHEVSAGATTINATVVNWTGSQQSGKVEVNLICIKS